MKAFTYHYAQPPQYHFCLESIAMPHLAAQKLSAFPLEERREWKVLDLCAGCGVLGFELQFYLRDLTTIDFVEIQEEYAGYFHENVKTVNRPEASFNFLNINYETLLQEKYRNTYDVILCNPPFFRKEHATLGPNPFKNRCRFFLDSSFESLIKVIAHVLKPGGRAFLLLRSLAEHKLDSGQEIERLSENTLQIEETIKVRASFCHILSGRP